MPIKRTHKIPKTNDVFKTKDEKEVLKDHCDKMLLEVEKVDGDFHSVEMAEALVHSIPENYYLAFSDEELKVIYDWAKSMKTGDSYFVENKEEFAYLMFDAKANAIHEHFLYKGTLLDRANFIKTVQDLYENEAESFSEKLRLLGIIQVERGMIDKAQTEWRKYMNSNTEQAQNNLDTLLKRVMKGNTKKG